MKVKMLNGVIARLALCEDMRASHCEIEPPEGVDSKTEDCQIGKGLGYQGRSLSVGFMKMMKLDITPF